MIWPVGSKWPAHGPLYAELAVHSFMSRSATGLWDLAITDQSVLVIFLHNVVSTFLELLVHLVISFRMRERC